MDVGLLLSLMVKETAESAQLVLCSDYDYTLVEHSSSPLLQRVEEIKEQITVRKKYIIIFLPVHVSFKLSLMVFTEFFHFLLKTAECPILPYEERDPQAEYLLELLKQQTKVRRSKSSNGCICN